MVKKRWRVYLRVDIERAAACFSGSCRGAVVRELWVATVHSTRSGDQRCTGSKLCLLTRALRVRSGQFTHFSGAGNLQGKQLNSKATGDLAALQDEAGHKLLRGH